jgi:Flagellar transcriptional activator (FlhC)
MRVSDQRYDRDRKRLDLALRMIQHEARTCTIRVWTGVSDDRIRKLYRSYILGGGPDAVRRHRGKSPRQVGYFFRTPDISFQAGQLASIYLLYGLLAARAGRLEGRYRPGVLESCDLLCSAYETYARLHVPAQISFEHACFLLIALTRQNEIVIGRCTDCGGASVVDLMDGGTNRCAVCGNAAAC